MRSIRALLVLFVIACGWIAALLHRGFPLAWDEIEFFRATRWIGEGRVPYRDFWEHHLPLQWLLFAPVARLFGDGAGTSAIVAMRWAQVPLWCAALAAVLALARRSGVDRWPAWCALGFLLTSGSFVHSALQYRVELVGALSYLAALLIIGNHRKGWVRWLAFGALMSAAVLANMRLAPLVIFTGAVMMFWEAGDRRWRWNARSLWMAVGVGVVALPFLLWLRLTGAWPGFVEGVFRYNEVSNRWVEGAADTFLPRLLSPVPSRDLTAIALWLAALAGTGLALKDLRRPGPAQIAALLFVGSVASIAAVGVNYPYHFVIAYLLMVPLAGLGFQWLAGHPDRVKGSTMAALAIQATALLLGLVPLFSSSFGAGMDYQDLVMREADRRTKPSDTVWDGCGYALRRGPAYRYWFLPAGVRFMAKERLIEPFDFEQISANPPGAIIYNYRVHLWMLSFPRLANYVVHHYVPLYRNLWIPGMSAIVGAGSTPTIWRVPADGNYEVWASELLPKHPWLARPMEYGMFEGADAMLMEIPLERLPAVRVDRLQWVVNGRPLPPSTRMLALRKGDRLELTSGLPHRVGVLIAPVGVRRLARAPEDRFLF